MKNFNFISKKAVYCLFSLLVTGVLFSSCMKDNTSTLVTQSSSLVLFVQAAPDLPPIDFYLDNSIVNTTALSYTGGINYLNVYTNTKAAYIYNHSTSAKLLTDSLHLKANTAYSLFLANTPANPQFVLLTDTIKQPAANSAGIRFINLSPDAPAVDFAITGGTVISSNQAFKSFTVFNPLPGNQTYTFVVRQAGTNTVLATLPAVYITTGTTYTFWFGGLAAGTTSADKLSLNAITNATF
jgi:hypothetical protein